MSLLRRHILAGLHLYCACEKEVIYMLGAIFGDITGSVYELDNTHDMGFPLLVKGSKPTDDTYMTLAVAKALMETYGEDDETIRKAVVHYMR